MLQTPIFPTSYPHNLDNTFPTYLLPEPLRSMLPTDDCLLWQGYWRDGSIPNTQIHGNRFDPRVILLHWHCSVQSEYKLKFLPCPNHEHCVNPTHLRVRIRQTPYLRQRLLISKSEDVSKKPTQMAQDTPPPTSGGVVAATSVPPPPEPSLSALQDIIYDFRDEIKTLQDITSILNDGLPPHLQYTVTETGVRQAVLGMRLPLDDLRASLGLESLV